MPFEKIGDENLDTVVNVRLTTSEKDRLRHDAEMSALSMSELVRRRYFGRTVVANVDLVMLNELRRIGGLLKHIHVDSAGQYSHATAGALESVRCYILQLSTKLR